MLQAVSENSKCHLGLDLIEHHQSQSFGQRDVVNFKVVWRRAGIVQYKLPALFRSLANLLKVPYLCTFDFVLDV